MVDFRTHRQIPTQAIIDAYGRSPQADMINTGMAGIEKGMAFAENMRAVREKRERAKLLAKVIQSPEVQQMGQEYGLNSEQVALAASDNPTTFFKTVVDYKTEKNKLAAIKPPKPEQTEEERLRQIKLDTAARLEAAEPYRKKALTDQQEAERAKKIIEAREEAKKMAKGGVVSSADAGKYVLATTSIKDVDDMIKIMFPDGTAQSFNRAAVIKGNMPLFGSAPLSKEGQKIASRAANALAGNLLIRSGVAVRPEELAATQKAFIPNAVSDPEAALDQLLRLKDFYVQYINTLKNPQINRENSPSPRMDINGQDTPASGGQPQGQPEILTATNPQTGQKIKSMDGGKTWQ